MTAIVLPVKNLEAAKQRQGPLLSAQDRSRLVWAMLKDVTQALHESQEAERILVVTADPQVAEYARRQSWEVMPEERQVSESHSVDAASRLLLQQGVSFRAAFTGRRSAVKSQRRRFSPGKSDWESVCSDGSLAGRYRYQRTVAITARRVSLVFRSRQLCASPGGGAAGWDLPAGGRKRKAGI